jgi:carbon-monoxide dehydrogenase large subunit
VGAKYFGASVLRREDGALLSGGGQYVDDIKLAGMLQATFLRSPHAHARIRSIDTDAARRMPGVAGVFTFESLERWMKPLPTRAATSPGLSAAINFKRKFADQYPLCKDTVRYVGETVAMVVADCRQTAETAAEAIEVEYEPLPAVVDVLEAVEERAPLLHPDWGDNVALAFTHTLGDSEGAFGEADVLVRERFRIQRYVGMPLEPRGIIARYDRRTGSLTTWNSTQLQHFVQQSIAAAMDLPVHRVRVIAPDVGGGFGTKAHGYAEDVLIPLVARKLDRPVKWIEDRREHMASAAHGREQVHDIEIAARRDGTILGVRDRILMDVGAYNLWHTLVYNSVGHLLGPHRVRNLAVDVKTVVTNKMLQAPYRGAGRPEAVFAMDRIVDCLARELDMDPAELRRRNYIRAEEFPYSVGLPYLDGTPLVYDSGDYAAALEQALEGAEYRRFRAEQEQLRGQGMYRGIGISGYVEGTGLGPYESASVRVDLSGRVSVATGASSQGQGHETAFAQVAADALGVPQEWVTVVGGDTAAVPYGIGTFASRCAITAGSSIAIAAAELKEKLLRAAAGLMEVDAADVEMEDGQVFVRGMPASSMPLDKLIRSHLPTFTTPGLAPPDFQASAYYEVPTVTFASAVHVAQVEVDPETGIVKVLRYVVAHDCGKLINPLIVEGQVRGGTAQGIGGALLEELVYDADGQLLTGSLMDYLLPTAMDVPNIETIHLEFPSPRNPLGVKGVGEGGAISPPAAIANAIEDALAPFDVRITETPVSPARIVVLVRAARRA